MLTDFVCRVCLCTNKLLRELDAEVAAHFEKLCEYNNGVSTLQCCSICEESLKYSMYFKNKCWKANKLLQRWLKCSSQERKPIESLNQQLDAWTEANPDQKHFELKHKKSSTLHNNETNENIIENYEITKTDMECDEINQEVMENVTDDDVYTDAYKVIFSAEGLNDESYVFKLKNKNINDSQSRDNKKMKVEQEEQVTYFDYEVLDECDVSFDQEIKNKELTQELDQDEILHMSNTDPGHSNESKFKMHLIEAKQDVCDELTTHDYLSAYHRCETCYTVFRNAKLLQNHIKKWHNVLNNFQEKKPTKSLHELLDKSTEANTKQKHFKAKHEKYTLYEDTKNYKRYNDESGNYIIIKTDDLEYDEMNQELKATITDTDVTENDIYKVISPGKSDVKNVMINNNHRQPGDNDAKYNEENIDSQINYTDYEVLLSEDSDEHFKENTDSEFYTDEVLHEYNDYFDSTGMKEELENKELIKSKLASSTTKSSQVEILRKHNPGPDYSKYDSMFNMHLFKTKQDIRDEFQRRRVSDPYLSANHRCEICYTVYRSEKLLQYHMKWHDPVAGKFECDICHMRFKTSATLSRHMNHAHRGIFTCKACPFSSYYSSAMVKHKHFVDRPVDSDIAPTISCEPCGLTFANRPVYNLHLMRTDAHKHIATSIIACCICGENFNNKQQMESHKQSAHAPVITPQRRYKTRSVDCPVCGDTGPNTPWLIFHYRRSHPTEVYSPPPGRERLHLCEQCGRSFVNATLLIEHVRVHTGVRPFQCDYCKNRFRTKDLLRSHMVWHMPPTLQCRECGKMYHKYNGLMSHIRVHNNDRCFKCLTCGAGFFSGSQMREHERGVHLRQRRTRRDKHARTSEGTNQ